MVLTSFGSGRPDDQPLYDRLWGSGFLPTVPQGVKFRNSGDAVLYLSNPPGIDPQTRRSTLDRLKALNEQRHQTVGDPEIATRIAQYEMAFRMQSSVPELLDLKNEPSTSWRCTGPMSRARSYAANCLLARRLAERDVRLSSCSTWAGTTTAGCRMRSRGQCKDTDQGRTRCSRISSSVAC